MKTLDTYNKLGGWDFKWDDIEWLQDSFIEVISGLGSTVGNCILSGCELTNNDTEYNSGFIYYNGKVIFLDSGNITTEGTPTDPTFYFKIVTTYAPEGSRTTQPGSSIEIYKVVRAIVVIAESGLAGNYVEFDSLKGFQTIINEKVTPYLIDKKEWNNAPTNLLNGWAGTISARKDVLGNVHLWIDANGSSATSAEVFQMPANWRGDVRSFCIDSNGNYRTIEINASGSIFIQTGGNIRFSTSYLAIQ